MNRQYKQLTQPQRYQIEAFHDQGFSLRQIGERIRRHHSVVGRELERNSVNGHYCAETAHQLASLRRIQAKKASKRSSKIGNAIEYALLMKWSPSQLRSRMEVEWPKCQLVSVPTLYRRIIENRQAGGSWYKQLPRFGKTRWRGGKRKAGRNVIPNRVGIEQRPEVTDARTRLGDWEGDTIKGKSAHMVTLVDRKSRLLLAGLVPDMRKRTVTNKLNFMLKGLTHKHTLTLDNGGEFAGHEDVANTTGVDVYFADPYSSHQRGSNENGNGLLRRRWPKSTDFSTNYGSV